MGKKVETYAVVEAGLEKPREILRDIVENTIEGEETGSIEEARKWLDDLDSGVRDPKEDYHKIVKITIEDITTLDDAIAVRAGA